MTTKSVPFKMDVNGLENQREPEWRRHDPIIQRVVRSAKHTNQTEPLEMSRRETNNENDSALIGRFRIGFGMRKP
ncbi:MAG: hypothetical protein K0Q73_3781 [Paenibacillus sp.]|nr:hypothetical protein [Paenibacillus sp.]